MKNNKLNKFIILSICLFSLVFSVNAETRKELKIEHTIDSKFPAEKRPITVQLPKSYYSQTEYKYPVIYLLDGQNNLGYSKTVTEFLSDAGLIPEVIIVGIHSGQGRARDYLPKNTTSPQHGGNANQFLNFIEKELIPFVENKYRAAPFKILSGHSFGGIFVTHTMIEKPSMFNAYFAQSPFLNKPIGDPILKRMEIFLDKNPKVDSFYYMNLGDEPNLQSNFDKLKELFAKKSPESFRWFAELQPLKTHMTTRLVGQNNALENFFVKDWSFAGKKIGVKAHVEGLSKKYGYAVFVKEATIRQAINQFARSGDFKSAIEAAEFLSNRNSESVFAHFILSQLYSRVGKKQEAITSIEKAIKLFEAAPEPKSKQFLAQMKQIQKQIKSN